jgi:hypothetical protein
MHAAEVRVHGAVDLQGLLQLGQDIAEAAGLDDGRGAVAVGGGDGGVAAVAVHGVALPDDDVAGVADRGDVGGQVLGDLVGAVARDEGHFADFVGGVEDVEEGGQVGGGHGRADFDTDRVVEAAEELDVGVGELAGAVADPQEVGGGVVVAGAAGSGCVCRGGGGGGGEGGEGGGRSCGSGLGLRRSWGGCGGLRGFLAAQAGLGWCLEGA